MNRYDTAYQQLRGRPGTHDAAAVDALALVHAVFTEVNDTATGEPSSAIAPTDLLAP